MGATDARVVPLLKVRDGQELRALGPRVFPGSVIVEGDLETPFPVRVLGDLEVRGSAVRPRLEVMGSLFIRDGLIGHAGAPVRVGGIVSAGFFDRAYVIAHTAHVRRYSLKSRLLALDQVLAAGDASIQGGLVAALRRVQAGCLGSRNALATEVVVAAPALVAQFVETFQGWAETAREEGAGEELRAAAAGWERAAAELRTPDPLEAGIGAQEVHPGVTIRIETAVRQLDTAVGPVEFSFERVGSRGRVALTRR